MDTYAILVVDPTGVIRMWSSGAERLLGYDAASAVGSTLDLIVPEAYREQHWAGFHAAMRSGRLKGGVDQLTGPLSVLCRGGKVAEFPSRFILRRDAEEKVVGAMAILAANHGTED